MSDSTLSILAETPAEESQRIDRSVRGPVLTFFISATLWLMLATLFGVIDSIKLHSPNFLNQVSWLSYGRIHAAYWNTLVYGWGSTAGFGVVIWLLARLSHTTMRGRSILVTASVLWNFALGVGILGILGGISTGVEWLELPGYSTGMLFTAYALISIWGVVSLRLKSNERFYISEFYLIAALLWFPWSFGTAQVILHLNPARPALLGLVSWWFGHNLLALWFVPIGIAAAYFFIPKITTQPIRNYNLAKFAFWFLALLSGWNGAYYLTGGPFPTWVVSASIVAAIVSLLPVAIIAINLLGTLKGHFDLLDSSPTLRFVALGTAAFLLYGIEEAFIAMRSTGSIFDFTLLNTAHVQLDIYASFSMIMFGAIYYIVPRLLGYEWRSALLIRLHFWASFYGILLMMLMLHVGGLVQGTSINDVALPFQATVERMQAYLIGRSLSVMLLTLAHFVFLFHFTLMLLSVGQVKGKSALFEKEGASI